MPRGTAEAGSGEGPQNSGSDESDGFDPVTGKLEAHYMRYLSTKYPRARSEEIKKLVDEAMADEDFKELISSNLMWYERVKRENPELNVDDWWFGGAPSEGDPFPLRWDSQES